MSQPTEQIEATIAALEAQRSLLGNAIVDSALEPLRRELAARRSPDSTASAQLKQVSVLFVDVVGSTAMGQQLQPEDIHAVMDGALERFTEIVGANHGRVLQYTGDGILAAFGTETAREDDAENAIRAGLGVIAEARRQAPDMRRAHGVSDFAVRAGINTGTVLLGAGIDAEGSIRGAVVNIAARMEQSAPAGGLRISHDTYRHVRGVFEMAEQPAISVKGVATPVRNYLVQGARPRAFRIETRGIEGVETKIVGRERELGRLQAGFDAVATTRTLRAVTVIASAGIGKSRLRGEFQHALETHAAVYWLLPGRAHPRSDLQPYDLLRDLLTRQFKIADVDTPEEARRKLVDGLAPLFRDEGEGPAHVLGHLVGLDFSASPHLAPILNDAAEIRSRAYDAVAQFLRRLSASNGAPVVLVLEDLHWADDGSLELVRHVMRTNRDAPLMLLMLARPELVERCDGWLNDDPSHERIELAPLDSSHSDRLVAILLQRMHEVPAALHDLITRGAEGNPFFMEELVMMLIDDGVIAADADGWRVVADKLSKVRVPPTLTGVLQARIDALRPREKSALQSAAIIGQVFSDEVLAAIDATAVDVLPTLLRKQLIVYCNTRELDGVRGYAFQHNLLHQVVYDCVLKGPKRSGHSKVGGYWSKRAEVSAPKEVNPAACRALVEAHFHLCEADPVQYVPWFDRQFFNYLNAYASQTLRPLADRLIGVCEQHFGPDHPETAKALTNLARVMLAQRDAGQAEPLLRRAIAIQELDPGADHPDTARTIAVLGGYFSGRGDFHAAEPLIRRALEVRERALGAEHSLTVGTLDLLASTVAELGRNDEAETLSRRVLETRERILGIDHPDTWFALTSLGDVLTKKKDHAAAEPLIRRALAAQQRSLAADHPETGLSMWSLAEALRGLGRHAEAEQYVRQSLQIWESSLSADHEWTAWGLSSLAKLRLAQGDPLEAAELVQRALRIHQQTFGAAHRTVAENLDVLARALLATGNFEAAEQALERALAIHLDPATADEPAAQASGELLASIQAELARC